MTALPQQALRLPPALPGRDGTSVIAEWRPLMLGRADRKFVRPRSWAEAVAQAREVLSRAGFTEDCGHHYLGQDEWAFWLVADPKRRIHPDLAEEVGVAYLGGKAPAWTSLPDELQEAAGGEHSELAAAMRLLVSEERLSRYDGDLTFRDTSILELAFAAGTEAGETWAQRKAAEEARALGRDRNRDKMERVQARLLAMYDFIATKGPPSDLPSAMAIAREAHAVRMQFAPFRSIPFQADPRETQKEVSRLLRIYDVCHDRRNGLEVAKRMIESEHEAGEFG